MRKGFYKDLPLDKIETLKGGSIIMDFDRGVFLEDTLVRSPISEPSLVVTRENEVKPCVIYVTSKRATQTTGTLVLDIYSKFYRMFDSPIRERHSQISLATWNTGQGDVSRRIDFAIGSLIDPLRDKSKLFAIELFHVFFVLYYSVGSNVIRRDFQPITVYAKQLN